MPVAARPSRCCFLPPHLLRAVAERGTPLQRERALRTLAADGVLRQARAARVPHAAPPPAEPAPRRSVADAGGGEELPGRTVRTEGAPPSGDPAVDEAYDGLGLTWSLFWDVHRRDSLDGAGLPLLATVHFSVDYDNAFWDGTQMVFGDGDGELFGRFTASLDVIAHELVHGVTDHEAGLLYQDQAGALNESLSDVFGSLVQQRAKGQSVEEADWLIGDELLRPGVSGVALRSLKAPGTAYDDDVLGRDPQPAVMADYVTTDQDNGGVHINSGIPNSAFYRAATAVGGRAWETVGPVWYAALRDPELRPDVDFATFAGLTVRAAEPAGLVDPVRTAWEAVGVLPGPDGSPT